MGKNIFFTKIRRPTLYYSRETEKRHIVVSLLKGKSMLTYIEVIKVRFKKMSLIIQFTPRLMIKMKKERNIEKGVVIL